jgi:hypothetical protein
MSWLRAAIVGSLLLAAVMPASAAWAAPAECQQYTSHGFCVVTAGTDGQSGQPSSPSPADGGGTTAAAACTDTSLGVTVDCSSAAGWWSQGKQCYVSPLQDPPDSSSPMWGGHTDGALYYCTPFTNGVSFPGTNGYTFWSATTPAGPAAVDPAVLAQQALNTVVLPSPTAGRYPAGTLADGRPYTVVNAHTWYWTNPGDYQATSARADAGGVWAEVTVTPTALTFSPGDGSAAVSCAGPGTPWQPTAGVWSPSPTGCDYRYPGSSVGEPDGKVTAVYGIQWSITWTSSTGATGTLPQITTSSTAEFAVVEAQTVVTR